MPPPARPKIYHIIHVDRLSSIIADGELWSDAAFQTRPQLGTIIGMNTIKQRRLVIPVKCRPGLKVGDCVPFYFCPRSVMLYVIHKDNHPNLGYHGGQAPIVHLEADLHETVIWAKRNRRRWAFTLSNAGSGYFHDRCDLAQLREIDWDAVQARDWSECKDGKQAEFLVERSYPWTLIRRIGVLNRQTCDVVTESMRSATHQPAVKIQRSWYY